MFSLGAENWTAFQQLEFAAKWDVKVVHFSELYRNQPAWEFARFLALAEKGQPSLESPPDPSSTPAARSVANVESSIRWTQHS